MIEACGVAVRFAADFLSWDEDEPDRRLVALRQYLTGPDMPSVGWCGGGRQRADVVTAGRVVVLGSGVVIVEVTARVMLYRRLEPESVPPQVLAPSSAPAAAVNGGGLGSPWWARITVPVRRDFDARVIVDLHLDVTSTAVQAGWSC
jgi:hypothetical protein